MIDERQMMRNERDRGNVHPLVKVIVNIYVLLQRTRPITSDSTRARDMKTKRTFTEVVKKRFALLCKEGCHQL